MGLGHSTVFLGVTLMAFSAVPFLTRPFLGQAVDRWSARGTSVVGALAMGAGAFIYPTGVVPLLLSARVVQGVGWAGMNTASTVVASDNAPASRRGEAMGYVTMMPSVAMALLPPLGL